MFLIFLHEGFFMNISRNMFFAAVAVAVVCGGSVSAVDSPGLKENLAANIQTPEGVAIVMTAVGVAVAGNTSHRTVYHRVGEAVRNGGIAAGVHVLASENPTIPGVFAAAGADVAVTEGGSFVASTEAGQSVAAKAPGFVRDHGNWLKHCAGLVGGHFVGNIVDQKMK
jgi:hypothetical protein